MRFPKKTFLGAIAVSLSVFAPGASAVLIEYDIRWEGIDGSSAIATGMITADTDVLPNPTGMGIFFDPFAAFGFSNFMIQISGAASGNGTFIESDFYQVAWSTGGGTLDLTMELVGQPTSAAPWATQGGTAGDFNVFANNANAPNGSEPFVLQTSDGTGDRLKIVSFEPKNVPDGGSSLVLLGVVLGACRGLRRWWRGFDS